MKSKKKVLGCFKGIFLKNLLRGAIEFLVSIKRAIKKNVLEILL